MSKVMNESIIKSEDLINAVEANTWMDVSETIKDAFHLENAACKEIIDPNMTLVEALTAMIIAETSKSHEKNAMIKPKGKKTMKKATIHLLPEFSCDMTPAQRDERFMANWELAVTIDFIPDSLGTLKAIDYTELKMFMNQNDGFFTAAVELCTDLIEDLIKAEKEIAAEMFEDGEIDEPDYQAIQSVVTLEDLLNSGWFCEDFEDSKGEFINILLEDHLFKTHR